MTDPMEMLKALEIISKICCEIGLNDIMDNIKLALEKRLSIALGVELPPSEDE